MLNVLNINNQFGYNKNVDNYNCLQCRERSCTYGVNQNGVHILTTTIIIYQNYTNPYHIPKI